jgi:hypothetical protein
MSLRSFHTAHCIDCGTEHEHSYVKGTTSLASLLHPAQGFGA